MRRTKAEAAETRASLMAAAEQMFFEKGVTATTLDEIASAANLTRGAIYWHFKSKTDLFLELYDSVRLSDITMFELLQADARDRDPLSALQSATEDWLRLVSTDVPRQRMLTILARTNFTGELEPVANAMAENYAKQMETLIEVLDRAASTGSLSPGWTPQCAAWTFKWLVNGMCWEWLLHGQRFDLVQKGSEAVRKTIECFRGSSMPTNGSSDTQ
ncbi:TetR/AcrR family acrAB operon transcriptional repressor [Rhizobium petrolearium]|uniref:TetR family transcriptional regulator n=2 Tax=Neorhizobium TaxID=1525371 RepID=A0ABV0MBZ5_9HYPH|nr:TetR family transcriptional regulator [Neorhizobium petrolearium]MBP1848308.1 TetR/AcrR family acrAB operon transcriptional repressor [Neorhizobium petrolearium]MCC2614464.1 TetR family transcriptional regulator [Neorhizobium petrolearium]WGI72229.1 TetR family transcriptional regulator [Neorhizobium petrolearium]